MCYAQEGENLEKKKKIGFASSMLFIGGSSLISMVVGLLTTPIITRIVNPDSFGQLSIFTMYTNLAVMVLCLGMDQSLVRFYYEKDDINYKKEILRECMGLPLIVSTVCVTIALFLLFSGIVTFEFSTQMTTILVINIFAGLLYRFLAMAVRLNYKNRLYAGLNIITKISYVVFALVLVFFTHVSDFSALAIATTLTSILVFIIAVISQRKYICIRKKHTISDIVPYSELLKYGVPFIFSLGITTLFQSLDKISLNKYATYTEVGIYSSAMTLVHIFAILQTSFNTVWAPVAIEHHLQNPHDKNYYRRAFEGITVLMFGMGIALILIKDVFALLLGEKYREAAYILPFLIFNPIMYTVSETTVCGIDFEKKSKVHILIAVVSCAVNYIGNTILVPVLGGKGAAISTGLSYIVFFSMRTYLGKRFFDAGNNLIKFYALTIMVIGYAFYNTFYEFNIITVLFAACCYVFLFASYHKSIKWLLQYILNYVGGFIKRKTN